MSSGSGLHGIGAADEAAGLVVGASALMVASSGDVRAVSAACSEGAGDVDEAFRCAAPDGECLSGSICGTEKEGKEEQL